MRCPGDKQPVHACMFSCASNLLPAFAHAAFIRPLHRFVMTPCAERTQMQCFAHACVSAMHRLSAMKRFLPVAMRNCRKYRREPYQTIKLVRVYCHNCKHMSTLAKRVSSGVASQSVTVADWLRELDFGRFRQPGVVFTVRIAACAILCLMVRCSLQ